MINGRRLMEEKNKEQLARHQGCRSRSEIVYKSKERDVKRCESTDKRCYLEELTDDTEQAAAKSEMSVVYKIT